MRWARRSVVAIFLFGAHVALAEGCVIPEIDIAGRACPCVEGWRCVDGICVNTAADAAPSDGGLDAPMDAPIADAPTSDAPIVDASGDARDTSTGDAQVDSAVVDSSVDSGMDTGMDAGLDETACDDLHSGALFCDGFESPGLVAWAETRTTMGSASRSTATTYRGDGSLHAETTAGSGRANVIAYELGGRSTGELWARFYLYVPSPYAVTDINVMTIHEDAVPFGGVGVGIFRGDQPYIYFGTASRTAYAPVATITRDRWTCWQLHVEIGSRGAADLRIDGVEVAADTDIDTLPSAGFTSIVTGIGYSDPDQVPATVFVDELIIDDSPVGCD